MKKNLLFVMPSLSAGGGEKSLVNLLSQIDYDLYNVDLFLFNHSGVFLNAIPREVNVLELTNNYKIFTKGLRNSIKTFLKRPIQNRLIPRLMSATLVTRFSISRAMWA